jgi:hypothetical protein
MKLTAELESAGGNATGIRVPDEFVAELGGGGRPKIVATVNGHQWRSSIARMGGEYWLGVSAANRSGAGVKAGDVLDVDVVLDTGVREVEVPVDLARALAVNPEAQAFWDTLSFSNKRYHVEQIAGAKTDATRERRVAKSVQLMSEGKAR